MDALQHAVLPHQWRELRVRLRYRGCRLEVSASVDRLQVVSQAPVQLAVTGSPHRLVPAGTTRWRRSEEGWRDEP